MALFFFDIHDGEALPDHQGRELRDLAAAQAYATEIALSYLRQDPALLWREHSWRIDIRDGDGFVHHSLEFKASQYR